MTKQKNYGKSVRTKLLNLMNKTGYKYMYLLARYFNERLLYRVSISPYKDNFLLKGGSLLYALRGLEARPTIDIDLMANNISRGIGPLTETFKEILSIRCDEDGVAFDSESLKSEPIAVDKKYPGTRFHFTANMDTIVQSMSIDIGFGDVVTPQPIQIDFPLLLHDVPSVSLRAYSLETVVAEKFHTMLDRDVFNSRMKDFFDSYQILTSYDIDSEELYEAIKATFDNRKLEHLTDRQLFSESFAKNPDRNVRWNTFLKKINGRKSFLSPLLCNSLERNFSPLK